MGKHIDDYSENIFQDNTSLMGRRHFLIRALNNHNITQEEYDREMPELEKKIQLNLSRKLKENQEELKNEITQLKNVLVSDGDLKRGAARIIIRFLKDYFTEEEIKGIMRQGYKIQRGV